jgi:Diguanylate cyclase, GGDEF domain
MLLLYCDVNDSKNKSTIPMGTGRSSHDGRTGGGIPRFRYSGTPGWRRIRGLALEASSQNEGLILHLLEKSLKKSNTNESRYELSLSAGVARFDPQHAVSLAELMERADRDMYEQKTKASWTLLEQPMNSHPGPAENHRREEGLVYAIRWTN